MRVLNERPPIWDKANAVFALHNGVIFTYGDTIYNPGGIYITPDLHRHEETHMRQQGEDPLAWWDQYLVDASFRGEQEVAAYAAQYVFWCNGHKDRNARTTYLNRLASSLCSPLYGSPYPHHEGVALIKKASAIHR